MQVSAKDAVVIATATPITHNLVDSGVRALAVHGKHSPKRRQAAFNMSILIGGGRGVGLDEHWNNYISPAVV